LRVFSVVMNILSECRVLKLLFNTCTELDVDDILEDEGRCDVIPAPGIEDLSWSKPLGNQTEPKQVPIIDSIIRREVLLKRG
jgi:hypothetical protein